MEGRAAVIALCMLSLAVCSRTAACADGAAAPENPGAITAEMRAADARLETKIALSEPRTRLGTLLEKIARTTGVALAADRRDGTADVYVQAYCDGLPVADVMNGLWSLLSYRKAELEWHAEGPKEKHSYTLGRPWRADQFALLLKCNPHTGLTRALSHRLTRTADGAILRAIP